MKPLLVAEGVALPGRLRPTSLSLDPGTLTCLIGPNGSGKTSLLHALAGIADAGGVVTIDGQDPRSLGPGQRETYFTFLPASRGAKWPVSAAELVALGSPGKADRIPALLEEMGVGELASRRIDRLSTGERSRVMIARALLSEPRVLLLDEPVANLDPLWQLRLMEHLRALTRAAPRSVLTAVHDLELARRYADRLIIMDGGRIVAVGAPSELLASAHMRDVFGIMPGPAGWEPAT